MQLVSILEEITFSTETILIQLQCLSFYIMSPFISTME